MLIDIEFKICFLSGKSWICGGILVKITNKKMSLRHEAIARKHGRSV